MTHVHFCVLTYVTPRKEVFQSKLVGSFVRMMSFDGDLLEIRVKFQWLG